MKLLRFLSRIAFICNLFFLLTVMMHWSTLFQNEAVVAVIIILGYFLAVFVFNPLVTILYSILLLRRRNLFAIVPKWLVITNFVFLLLQLIYILFILQNA